MLTARSMVLAKFACHVDLCNVGLHQVSLVYLMPSLMVCAVCTMHAYSVCLTCMLIRVLKQGECWNIVLQPHSSPMLFTRTALSASTGFNLMSFG